MEALLAAIVADDGAKVETLLTRDRSLATRLVGKPKLYQSGIFHWLYAGDTALHLAAAGYRVEIARLLLGAGADPTASASHRRSSPLHYAADGYINGPAWDAKSQVRMIQSLLEAGADPLLRNKPGSAPFHLAVQNTGRGGSGAAVAVEAQEQIIKEFISFGLSPELKTSGGKTVRDCAQSAWIKELLRAA